MQAIAKAQECDKVRVASAEMIKTPLWLIEQILLKHETAVIEVMKELNDEMLALKRAVKRVHEAKGRYYSQIAMCDLYDLCKLPTKGR
ncbi:MAG: hypothetical protein D4R79_00625 [Comamonadaceae bacterium]|nr:MAG: hypothetical protein D4R79_00625 [Comamonadaceae bacterium]